MFGSKRAFLLLAVMLAGAGAARSQQGNFHLEEATIDDVHRAIRDGRITCRGLVQLYVNRAKAYNGVSNVLVTKDGEPIPPAPGVVRAGFPLKFPTQTVAISTVSAL
jgi:amidase